MRIRDLQLQKRLYNTDWKEREITEKGSQSMQVIAGIAGTWTQHFIN